MKIIRVILQVAVISLAAYSLLAGHLAMTPYVLLLTGMFMLVFGFEQIEKDRKGFNGYAFVAISLLLFMVSWQNFILGA